MTEPWLCSVPPSEAQKQINFRLLLPRGHEPTMVSLRREGPPFALHPAPDRTVWSQWCGAHTASVCFDIPLGDTYLRCKQYLYDLGPLSTLDHAALYDQSAQTMTAHHLPEGGIGWVGVDYAGAPAVTWLQHGTNVELRSLSGPFDTDTVLRLAGGFRPIDSAEMQPFSARSYWARHDRYDLHLPRGLYRPPSSLWRLRWPWIAASHKWSDGAEPRLIAAVGADWQCDGTCTIGGDPDEIISRFIRTNTGRAVLWLRRFRPCPETIFDPQGKLPPLDSHSGFTAFEITQSTASGLTCLTASRDAGIGPHDTLFWRDGWGYLVQQSSHATGSLAAHLALVGRITTALA